MQNKPKIMRAIFTFVVAFIVFVLSYFLTYLIVGWIILLLAKIPLLSKLIDWIFFIRGDSPDLMLSLMCPGIAYSVTMLVQEAMNKDDPTKGLSCVILGVCIALIHVISIVINLIYGERILKNIVQIITGCIIFRSGLGMLKDSNS